MEYNGWKNYETWAAVSYALNEDIEGDSAVEMRGYLEDEARESVSGLLLDLLLAAIQEIDFNRVWEAYRESQG